MIKNLRRRRNLLLFVNFLSLIRLAPCKGIHDSLGFGIPHCGFRIPGTGFRIPAQWIPKRAGVHFFSVGSRITIVAGFWISKAKISWILESGFTYMGRQTFRVKFRNNFCKRCFIVITLKIEEEKDTTFRRNSAWRGFLLTHPRQDCRLKP